jgi:hypothetical protein
MLRPVNFEDILTILLGWVGQRLSVGIATGGDAPIMIANMLGTLRAGTELEAAGEEGAVFFVFEDGGTGFILARQHFAGGGFHEDDPSTLVVRLGAVSLWIEQQQGEQ